MEVRVKAKTPFEEESKGCNAESGDEMAVGHECKNEGALIDNNFAENLQSGGNNLDSQHCENGARCVQQFVNTHVFVFLSYLLPACMFFRDRERAREFIPTQEQTNKKEKGNLFSSCSMRLNDMRPTLSLSPIGS